MGRRSFLIVALFVLAGLMGPALWASGYEFPDIALTPSSHDFGEVTFPTSSATLEVSISNRGLGDLAVREMYLVTDRHFHLDPAKGDAPCGSLSPVIAPGASCTVTITFTPREEGELTDHLVIKSDDPDTPEVRMPLQGAGRMPEGDYSHHGTMHR